VDLEQLALHDQRADLLEIELVARSGTSSSVAAGERAATTTNNTPGTTTRTTIVARVAGRPSSDTGTPPTSGGAGGGGVQSSEKPTIGESAEVTLARGGLPSVLEGSSAAAATVVPVCHGTPSTPARSGRRERAARRREAAARPRSSSPGC
jgi:hypothetical protein